MITDDRLIDTAEEFLDFFLKNARFRTTNRFVASSPGKGMSIFRGQSDSTWGLVPTAFRYDPFTDFATQPPTALRTEGEPLSWHLGFQLQAELRAVWLFLDSADQLGIPTPIDYTTINEGREIIEAAIRDQDYDFSEMFPPLRYEASVALAQHYGVPTRFLDWSSSPLTACFFAAYSASSFAASPPRSDQEIAVYFLSLSSISNLESPVTLVKTPKYQNDHIRAQQGLFTNFKNANEYFLKQSKWPDLKDLASSGFQISRRRLPASESDSLLRLLFDMGTTRETLMPSLQNAAKSYQYKRILFDQEKSRR